MSKKKIINNTVAVENVSYTNDMTIHIKGNKIYFFTKRIFDFFSSLFVIVILSWLLLIIFIIQLLVTKGHPIYKDFRIGYRGKKIGIFKFRSMHNDAYNLDKYFTEEQKEIWLRERKVENDPRITKFGKFLRKTSLDELPQLFNILLGSMSVVGPRPISEKELDNFSLYEKQVICSAKPGLTGYWQVYGRGEATFESGLRQKIELEYFSKRGLFFDLFLIIKTIPVVLAHKGAK